jgi:curved DNA-binding protein CbpA
MPERFNPYTVLGVTPTATLAEISHAFRARLRSLHPDTRSVGVGDAELRELLAAYEQLRDPDRRADYDQTATTAVKPPANPVQTSTDSVGPVQIPVTYRQAQNQPPGAERSLWAGPVRRHR